MRRSVRLAALAAVLVSLATVAGAQTLVANDDAYGVPFGQPLTVEVPGVLDNDTYNGGPAGGAGATVALVASPSFGTLECDSDPASFDLCPDGSFSYVPGPDFPGFDSFGYEAAVGGTTDQATVVLSACTGGPAVFECWHESAYLAKLGELGYSTFTEGFESDLAWGATRFPLTEPSVLSQGITWRSNHPDPPASNELTTGNGPAHTGMWGVYDPEHGYATGTPEECDINNPPDHCLFKDGLSGTREAGGSALVGVGGYFIGSLQPNLRVALDGGVPIGLGMVNPGVDQYFGVIDTGGFTTFRFEDADGKIGQERHVFADDFTLATSSADTTPPRVVLVSSYADTGDGVLAEGESTDAGIYQLLVSFSEPVLDLSGDAGPHDVTNPANYLLVNDGGNGFQTVDCAGGVAVGDVQVAVDAVSYISGSELTATLDINGGLDLPIGSYRLLVCGTTSIHDWAGNPLDGNGNGAGGDDFARNFSIIPPVNDPPVANPQSVTTAEDT
ncbi:MAG TPA: Ig-like domain-containing protein, partial [Thermoanaerobaculales bacterium]|nr:Ig-like domain-containing protein [Thermoanaerobaculales bacterium]HQP42369.1 Ig-like domain-containing protein [Thermoanaerobaculales bacterium]